MMVLRLIFYSLGLLPLSKSSWYNHPHQFMLEGSSCLFSPILITVLARCYLPNFSFFFLSFCRIRFPLSFLHAYPRRSQRLRDVRSLRNLLPFFLILLRHGLVAYLGLLIPGFDLSSPPFPCTPDFAAIVGYATERYSFSAPDYGTHPREFSVERLLHPLFLFPCLLQ